MLSKKNIYRCSIILTSLFHWIDCQGVSLSTRDQMIMSELVENIKQDPAYIFNELLFIFDIINTQNVNTEDVPLNITQLVTKYCCPIQEHHIITDDGYILTVFRMPSAGPAVLLMHGLFNSADDWVIAGPDSALAYILAEAGFDVWLGNARGTKYSRQHVSLSPHDPEFWDFSWNEIGNYDLPAMIDYILFMTNSSQLAYVGHSQGTTSFFVLCSDQPEYNSKISVMIALSPVAWVAHVKSIIVRLATPFILKMSWLLKLMKYYDLMPSNMDRISSICKIGNGILCITTLFSMCGFDYEQVNKTNTQNMAAHVIGGASLNQALHYLQLVESKTFRKFDYGANKNEDVYGFTKPPRYQVEKITAPVALFYSDNDLLSTIDDVLNLKRKIQNVITLYRVPFKKFNHLDYLYAKDVNRLVYSKVLQLLTSTHTTHTYN